MNNASSNGWKSWALAGVTGLFLGGSSGTMMGTYAADKVRIELNGKVSILEAKLEASKDVNVRILQSLARLEEQVKFLREKIEKSN